MKEPPQAPFTAPPFPERLNLEEITRTFSTPLFLYDAQAIRERIALVRHALGGNLHLYYAMKANPNPHLVRMILPLVDGLDISSGGELNLALELGCPPERISLAGPAKSMETLERAVTAGVGSISVETMEELTRLEELARRHNTTASLSLRINPVATFREFAVRMGGKPSQFGLDQEQMAEVVERLRQTPHLRLSGLHIFAGTQCLHPQALRDNLTNTLAVARELATLAGHPLERINMGGGLGVAYHEDQTPLDPHPLCQAIGEQVAAFRQSENRPDLTVILELGRFLMAEAGVYLTRVVAVKPSRETLFTLVDGGVHHHLAAGGLLGQVMRRNFRVRNLTPADPEELVTTTIAGTLCTSIDLLAVQVSLPRPRVGDLLAIPTSGAYAYTASPLLFLSHPTPAEVLVEETGEPRLIRASFDPARLGVPP